MPSRVRTAVTRGVMGLSCSRRDIDALNSNIKVFLAVPVTSSPSIAHAWLDRKTISHRITRRAAAKLLRQLICTSCPAASYANTLFLSPRLCSRLLFFFFLFLWRAHTVPPRCGIATEKRCGEKASDWATSRAVFKYSVDKILVLARVFALTPHQRRSRLPHRIIAMTPGQ